MPPETILAIRLEDFTPDANGDFNITASDLGLKPGEWPKNIDVHGSGRYGAFHRTTVMRVNGEFAGYHYDQVYGSLNTLIRIFND